MGKNTGLAKRARARRAKQINRTMQRKGIFNKCSVLILPYNSAFTKLDGFATLYGMEYHFSIDNVRFEKFCGQESGENAQITSDSGHWERLNFITSSEHTGVTLSKDFKNILDSNGSTKFSDGFKKNIFQSATIEECKHNIALYLNRLEKKQVVASHQQRIRGMGVYSGQNTCHPTTSYYNRIIEELNAVGWTYLVGVHDSMQRLELQTADREGRIHKFDVILDSNSKHGDTIALKTTLHIDIPALEKPHTGSGSNVSPTSTLSNGKMVLDGGEDSNLRDMIAFAENELEKYQLFWNIMDDLDSNVWVLEPQNPTRSSTVRRIAIKEHCSMHVKINPSNPKGICEFDFMGKASIVEPLRSKLHNNIEAWSDSYTPRENLQRLLGMEFPDPKVSADVNFQVECGVCYSYRRKANASAEKKNMQAGLNRDVAVYLPDFICNACGQAFHQLCVSEWLQSVPSTRRSFNMLFGSCPYCNAAVSVALNN